VGASSARGGLPSASRIGGEAVRAGALHASAVDTRMALVGPASGAPEQLSHLCRLQAARQHEHDCGAGAGCGTVPAQRAASARCRSRKGPDRGQPARPDCRPARCGPSPGRVDNRAVADRAANAAAWSAGTGRCRRRGGSGGAGYGPGLGASARIWATSAPGAGRERCRWSRFQVQRPLGSRRIVVLQAVAQRRGSRRGLKARARVTASSSEANSRESW